MNRTSDNRHEASTEIGGDRRAAPRQRRARLAVDVLGLSTTHNRPQPADLWQARVYDGGSLIEFHSPSIRGQKGGGKRGIVKRFSEASRRRLLRALSRTQRDKLPVFLTLTYPDGFPGDPRTWKAHLKAWLKRLARQHPGAAGFWKLELKARQSGENAKQVAPHFHLLMWGLPETWEQVDGRALTWRFMLQRNKTGAPGLVFWKQEKWCNGEWDSTSESMTGRDCVGSVVEFVSERINKRGQNIRTVELWKHDATGSFEQLVRDTAGDERKVGTVNLVHWVSLTWADIVKSGDPRHVEPPPNARTGAEVLWV